MCAVSAASLLSKAGSCSGFAFERKRCRAACVARKPRKCKLTATSGRSTVARRKSFRAGRSSALNRRNRSHISREYLEQPAIHEPAQKFRQVAVQHFRFDVEFREKFLVSRVNTRRSRHKLPHSRAYLVQSKVLLRLEIQQHRLPVQKANQNVRGRGGAAGK